jgi:hypothetical protein
MISQMLSPKRLFSMTRKNDWDAVYDGLKTNPKLALTVFSMENHITTTLLHQAITSKGNTLARTAVIAFILTAVPEAAKLANGYGSLPLHVIAQRNTKMDSKTKEALIFKLVEAYKDAVNIVGGVGRRTPLHILFTDYISPKLTHLMVSHGKEACFIQDKKGYLPAHIACSRHCSPDKLQMLLDVNPDALFAKTFAGDSLLSLAKQTATASHPNYKLVHAIHMHLRLARGETVKSSCALTLDAAPTFDSSSNESPASSQCAAAQQPFRLPIRKRKMRTPSDKNNCMPATKKRHVDESPVGLLLHFASAMEVAENNHVTAI